jgi:cupin fold WbuC family metalloprotein
VSLPKELLPFHELGLVPVAGGRTPAFTATKSRAVGPAVIEALKKIAKEPGATVRINLHAGPESSVHDMIIVQRSGGAPYIHRHKTREEAYHLIEGRLRLRLFDVDGVVESEILLGGPGTGLPFVTRIPAGVFHSTIPETEFAVFHESRPGPFDPSDTVVKN